MAADYDPTVDKGLAHRAVRKLGLTPRDADYDDAVQVAMIALIRAKKTWNAKVRPWGLWATIVLCRELQRWNLVRRRKGLTQVLDSRTDAEDCLETPTHRRVVGEVVGDEPDPDAQLMDSERAEQMKLIAARLPWRLQIICTGILAGKTMAEISRELHCTRPLVSYLVKKYRADLQAAFADLA